MALSTHAQAAKQIRSELKKHGVKASVRSESYAGGSSVRVALKGEAPWTVKAIQSFADRYQVGHFNGMEDIYEYSNNRDDLPQVKFVFVDNEFSADMRQKAYEHLRENFAGYEDHPELYTDAADLRGMVEWVSQEVHQVLNGLMDRRSLGLKFWNKPRVSAA